MIGDGRRSTQTVSRRREGGETPGDFTGRTDRGALPADWLGPRELAEIAQRDPKTALRVHTPQEAADYLGVPLLGKAEELLDGIRPQAFVATKGKTGDITKVGQGAEAVVYRSRAEPGVVYHLYHRKGFPRSSGQLGFVMMPQRSLRMVTGNLRDFAERTLYSQILPGVRAYNIVGVTEDGHVLTRSEDLPKAPARAFQAALEFIERHDYGFYDPPGEGGVLLLARVNGQIVGLGDLHAKNFRQAADGSGVISDFTPVFFGSPKALGRLGKEAVEQAAGLPDFGIPERGNVSYSLAQDLTSAEAMRVRDPLDLSDTEYLAAVGRGDMETAQRLVDEAAKAAGFNTSAPVWHTSISGPLRELKDTVFYVSPDADKQGSERMVQYYQRAKLHRLYLHRDVEIRLTTGQNEAGDIETGTGPLREVPTDAVAGDIYFNGRRVGAEIAIKDPRGIVKSADPVTYDETGQVIPLSERFNPASRSISYALRARDPLDLSDAQVQTMTLAVRDWANLEDWGGSERADEKVTLNEARRMLLTMAPEDVAAIFDGDPNVLTAGELEARLEQILPMLAAAMTEEIQGNLAEGFRAPEDMNSLLRERIQAVRDAGLDEEVKTGKPVKMTQIRDLLLRRLNLPARFGIRARGIAGALGIYKPSPEILRLRNTRDIETLAHEIGHHLHFVVFGRASDAKGRPVAPDFEQRFDQELLSLGQATSLPTYSPRQVRQEGVAEWLRHYLVAPSQARAAAPEFSTFFESELAERDPKVLAALREAQGLIDQFVHQPWASEFESAIDFGDNQHRSISERMEDAGRWFRKLYTNWFDDLAPLTRVQEQLVELGMDPKVAGRAKELAVNYQGGVASKAVGDLKFGQTDLEGQVVGKSLRRILGNLNRAQRRELSKYMARKRANELESRGIAVTGVPPIPKADMAQLEQRYEATRKQLLAFQSNSLRLMRDAGLLSKAQFAAMQKANRDYVPFYRIFEGVADAGGGPSTGRGFVDVSAGIRRIKGSDRVIIDPLESIVRNTFVFRAAAERNLVGRQFVDTVKQARGHGLILDEVMERKRPVEVTHEEMVGALQQAGVIHNEADLPPELTDLSFHIWRSMSRPDAQEGEFSVYRAGKAERYQVHDEALYNALTLASRSHVGLFLKIVPFAPAMNQAARLVRQGATMFPGFAAFNFVRDQVFAGFRSRTGFIPFWDGLRGMTSALFETKTYQHWVASGGKFSGMVTADRDAARQVLNEIGAEARPMALRLAHPQAWLRGMVKLIEAAEEASRVSEFRRAKALGYSDVEAANLSKDVTLNFSRGGAKGRVMNTMVPFINAGLQDVDTIRRALASQEATAGERTRAILKGMLLVTLPSVVAALMGDDDDELAALPDWRRDNFWNFNFREELEPLRPGWPHYILSIPKPFLLGAMFGTSVELAMAQASGKDPNGLRKALENLVSNTVFHGDLIQTPSLAHPLMEVMRGEQGFSSFTNRPIVPASLMNEPPELRFTDHTSEVAKAASLAMSKTVGWEVSPMKIDHLIRGYFASWGTMGTQAIDTAILATRREGLAAERQAKELLGKFTGVSRFGPKEFENTKYVNLMYQGVKAMEQSYLTESEMEKMSRAALERHYARRGDEWRWAAATHDLHGGRTNIGELRRRVREFSELSQAMRDLEPFRNHDRVNQKVLNERLIKLHQRRNELARETWDMLPSSVRRRVDAPAAPFNAGIR